VRDALVDPHQTISPPPPAKDCGYHELNKRSSVAHDLKSKVIKDYAGRNIIKIDSMHGMQNGGLFYQTSFSNLNGTDRPGNRQAFGYGTVGYNANQGHMANSKAF
jgi:hypothetical protein